MTLFKHISVVFLVLIVRNQKFLNSEQQKTRIFSQEKTLPRMTLWQRSLRYTARRSKAVRAAAETGSDFPRTRPLADDPPHRSPNIWLNKKVRGRKTGKPSLTLFILWVNSLLGQTLQICSTNDHSCSRGLKFRGTEIKNFPKNLDPHFF